MEFYTNVFSYGNSILYRCYDDVNGRTLEEIDDFVPKIWVPSNKKTKWRSITGAYAEPFVAGNIKETREFIREHQNASNSFPIFGDIQIPYQYITAQFPGDVDYDLTKINVCYLDIETECENGFPTVDLAQEQVNLIGLKMSLSKRKKLFGIGEYKGNDTAAEYIQCDNEEDLLQAFVEEWDAQKPDIVTGWNVKFFDIPYLVNRLKNVLGDGFAKKMSPWGVIQEKESEIRGMIQKSYHLVGVAILDYMELYKKFTYTNQESYSLNHIGSIELGISKLDYSEHGSLHTLYKQDFTKFVDYNIRDIDIVIKLEEKMKLVELAMIMAFDAKVNFDDVFSQVRMWDVIIYNHLLKKGIVIPPRKKSRKETIKGGYVKEPIIGFHEWCVSFDLNSLYPHLIMQYNISPEMLVDEPPINRSIEELLDGRFDASTLPPNQVMAANGIRFRTEEVGFLAELMEWMFKQRKQFKKYMIEAEKELEAGNVSDENKSKLENTISRYNNLQMAKKICLNSAYGAMGNVGFRYYDLRLAEAVTKSGQLSIRWVAGDLNVFLNKIAGTVDAEYIIAADTDSVYINMNPIVKKYIKTQDKSKIIDKIDKICEEQLTPFIDASYIRLAKFMRAKQNKMAMKREVIADRGIWTAKKRYILNVHDSEGIRYAEPKLKIKGIEAVRSSTPSICRDKIKEALKVIMTKSESDLHEFVSNFKKEFRTLKPEDVAFPRTCNNLSKYTDSVSIFKKGCPIHVRGSLLFNFYIDSLNLRSQYKTIKEGEKIKFLYLKEPNVIRQDIISFSTTLPEELGVTDCIDYDKQFQKTFIDPISIILNAIDWDYEKKNTLDDFFS